MPACHDIHKVLLLVGSPELLRPRQSVDWIQQKLDTGHSRERGALSGMPPISIASTELWINTGVRLEKGKAYDLVASGVWKDASIVTDPDGYDSVNFFQRITERLRRMPEAKWFALIGALDRRSETQFLIGSGKRYTPTENGQLTCFANDLRGFYFNNSGGITLTVKEST